MGCWACNPYCGNCKPPKERPLKCLVCGTYNFDFEVRKECKKCGAVLPERIKPPTVMCLRSGLICCNPCNRYKIKLRDGKTVPCHQNTPPNQKKNLKESEHMNVTLEKIEKSEAYLEIIIEAEKFEKGLEKSYKKNVRKYNVDGFREGCAPRTIVESKYGPEVLFEDAMEFVVPDEYYAAIKELQLDVVGEPDIEVGYIEKGKDISVKVCVPVKPVVTLVNLEGLEITVSKVDEVTDNDVEKYLQNLRSGNKIVIDKLQDPAAEGDTVTINYKSKLDGTAFDGQEDFKLMIGSDTFFPGFEEKLIGVKKGEKLDIEITFPMDHASVQLAGKKAEFKVQVNKVENIQLRELNDQFAQEITKVNSLEELRIEVKRQLNEIAVLRASNAEKQAVVKAALERCEIDVPDALIMEQAKSMLEQLSNEIKSEGGTLELYLQMINSDFESLKKKMWQDAKLVIKTSYLLEKIIEEQGFELTDEELNKGIELFAKSIGMDTENAKENIGPLINKVIFDVKSEKAAVFLLKSAVITIAEKEKKAKMNLSL